MPTTGPQPGHAIGLYISDTLIAYGTSDSFNLERDMRELAHKSQSPGSLAGGYAEKIGGTKRGSGSFEGYYTEDATRTTITSAWDADTTLTAVLTNQITGDTTIGFSMKVTSINFDFPEGEEATFSFEYQVTGTVTFGTVA